MKDIDTIAVELKKLQSASVPIIFRPLHEAEGGWFWWGAKGPEPAKKLWDILYDRLTNKHKLNNLIWEWNSVATSWYPGNSKVDLVSADTYNQGDHGVSKPFLISGQESHAFLPIFSLNMRKDLQLIMLNSLYPPHTTVYSPSRTTPRSSPQQKSDL